MKPETVTLLYKVGDKLSDLRDMLDDHMYRSGTLPEEDHEYCRKVYNAICKAMDLL
jgi:hypothetical protein